MEKKRLLTFNLICRDNQDSIVDCLDSTLEANVQDYILCDTGSKDMTIALALEWGIKNNREVKIVQYKDVYGYDWDANRIGTFDFGKAREICLRNTKTPYMIWIDTDDILLNAKRLQPLIEQVAAAKIDQVILPYRYGVDQHGNDIVYQYRERIIRAGEEVHWREPVHEYVDFPSSPTTISEESVVWMHKRKPEHVIRTSRRNRDILRNQLNEIEARGDRPHLRLIQNLAYDHFEHHEWDEAKTFYMRFFSIFGELPAKAKDKQMHIAQLGHNYMNWARCEIELDNLERAEEIIGKAKDIEELDKPIWLTLAELRLRQNKLDSALLYIDSAQKIGQKASLLPINMVDLETRPHLLLAEIYQRKNEFEKAIMHLQMCLKIVPSSRDVMARIQNLSNATEQKKAFDGYFSLKAALLNSGDWNKLDSLLKSLPSSVSAQQGVKEDFSNTVRDIAHYRDRMAIKVKDSKSIAIFTGIGYEEWAGDSRKTGIGGSEEMVIGMALQLQRLGNKVTVYNTPGKLAGEYEGVVYKDWHEYKPDKKFDVFIVSRVPQMFADSNGQALRYQLHNSNRQYLWLHDLQYGNAPLTAFGLPDKVFVLSEFHKRAIMQAHGVDESKFWVTRNGIDVEHYLSLVAPQRNPKRIIYCSSYDRGLYEVLLGFKDIKKAIPDAELIVHYGWDTYDKRMNMMPENFSDHPSQMSMKEYKRRVVELMTELGVKDGGRIGQDDLYLEMAKSSIWYYDTWFGEISCITAMRAQLAGTIPVHSGMAALAETVKEGFTLTGREASDKIIELIKNPDLTNEIRPKVVEAGKQFALSSLAKEWDDYFNKS